MTREEIFTYVLTKYQTIPQYKWPKYPLYAVLEHTNKKWYGLIMNIEKNKLGLNGEAQIDILNVKVPPELVGSLRMNKGFLKAYHMNKEHWVTIILNEVDQNKIKELIDLSYDLT